MFTKLTDTSKAAIFTVLVLCMAVGAALLIRFLGISSDPVIFSIWSCTPTVATLIMLLVVTREGYSREGWESPYTVLYYPRRLAGINRRLHYGEMDTRGDLLNAHRWWLDPSARRAAAAN